MPAESPDNARIGQIVQEVAERAQLLVREEIELAKAELTTKLTRIVKGAVVGVVGGVFLLLGLLRLLDAASLGVWRVVQGGAGVDYWVGPLIVGLVLFVVGAIAGFLASRLVKSGTPPTPVMAIEEAQRIRDTIRPPAGGPPEDRA